MHIVLYKPDIPQNTAAIIRTCACLGAELEIIEPCGFLLSDKRFKRVVMDYMEEKDIKFYNTPVQVQEDDGSIENIYGEIQFRKGTTKRRNKGKIKFITEPVKDLLDQIRAIYKRPGYEQYRLVPWLSLIHI